MKTGMHTKSHNCIGDVYLTIAEEIPEEKYAFRATPDCRSVAETLVHIAAGTRVQQEIHFGRRLSTLAGFDFPAFFGRVHSHFRTPHFSIVIFAVLLLVFSIAGDFRWNAMLSSVARLFVYGSVAAALPVLRKKQPHAERFRLPGGITFAVLALLFTAVLVTRMHRGEFIVICTTAVLAFGNWLWARNRAIGFDAES